MLERLQRRLRYWFNHDARERLLREEIESHLQIKVDELMAGGLAEEDARVAARRQFGNPTLHQEDSRATWIARWFTDLTHDAAYASRTLRKQPGFAAVVVLSAALGTGACSLIFSLANFALFRPLDVEEPGRLMSIYGKSLRRGKMGTSLAFPDIEEMRRAQSFDGVAAFFPFLPAAISAAGEPQRYWGSMVTANYFDVVRPNFLAGRGFDASRDDRKGETPAVVLGYTLWRTSFAADRGIVGRSILINGHSATVVGVTGPGFRGTEAGFYSDFWVPLSMIDTLAQTGMSTARLADRGGQWLLAVGRLRDGAAEQSAYSEIDVIGQRLRDAFPATNRDRDFHVERAGQANPGFRKMIVAFFAMLIGVAFLVLLAACANVANLLLARAVSRHQEIATRLAIGAGRTRLIRHLLTESILLALLGGAGGFALAYMGAAALATSRIPLAMPVDLTVTLDYRVVLFCGVLSALTGVVFGLAPALRSTRPDLVSALKNEQALVRKRRSVGPRSLLVVAQVAVSVVLLVCSGLFLRSFQSARQIDPGFTHRNLLLVGFDPSLSGYNPSATRRLLDRMERTVGTLPGVASVSLADSVPLSMEGTQNLFAPAEKAGDWENNGVRADIYSVGPRFFDTFGIRMLMGEDFRPLVPAEDVAILNQAAAEKAFPGQNPIGRHIAYLGRTVRIVGVVSTTKSRSIGEDPHPCLYLPLARSLRGNDSLTGMTLVVRTAGDAGTNAGLVREAIRQIEPALALFDVRTMDQHLYRALFLPRVAALLFGLAGAMGILIACIGVYGVVSFNVAQQSREIGIRMALGARRERVLAMVLKQAVVLTIAGSAIGLFIARGAGVFTSSLLYGISPKDPLTFTLVPLLLAAIALGACVIPARRAASIDPVRALRSE